MSINWIKRLFLVAALYDGVLGLAFLIAPAEIFVMYGVEPPNHMAFVQFPAFLLIIFAIMFYRVLRLRTESQLLFARPRI
jgi:hypothetical protein